MKLLFDNNLSVFLPDAVKVHFPGSMHVSDLGIDPFSDRELWHYAQMHQFTIVTKDKDFYHFVTTLGHPPKLVWLAIGNCKNSEVIALL
ncbi:MAG: DUF5615 family PIN-like protein [Flavisolibacter sp.]|nr:DUF5615 family PIN-like protein [Flavisolibacter sp.]